MSTDERIRKWLDGELDPIEESVLFAEAARSEHLGHALDDALALSACLSRLRAERAVPGGELVERAVQGAIAARKGRHARVAGCVRFRHRIFPFVSGQSPELWSVSVVLSALLAMWGWQRPAHRALATRARVEQPAHPTPASVASDPVSQPAARAPAGVAVRFKLTATHARTVGVAGDFNGWHADAAPLRDDDGDGVFVGVLQLPPGAHTYMFVVDGIHWVADPNADNVRDDGFGHLNAVLRID